MTPDAPRPALGDDRAVLRVVTPAAALVSLVLVSVVLSPLAEAGRSAPTVRLDLLRTHSDGGSGEPAAETPAFDPGADHASVVGADSPTVRTLLVLGDELAGTTTVHEVTGR